jgi:hypothetical protein
MTQLWMKLNWVNVWFHLGNPLCKKSYIPHHIPSIHSHIIHPSFMVNCGCWLAMAGAHWNNTSGRGSEGARMETWGRNWPHVLGIPYNNSSTHSSPFCGWPFCAWHHVEALPLGKSKPCPSFPFLSPFPFPFSFPSPPLPPPPNKTPDSCPIYIQKWYNPQMLQQQKQKQQQLPYL